MKSSILSLAIGAALAGIAASPSAAPAPTAGPRKQLEPAAASSATAARIAAIVDPIIEADMARSGAPGAAFVLVHGGRTVYQRGYGLSDVKSRVPADPEATLWPIASITKTITAAAALQLVAKGQVSLDKNVNRYVKRLKVPSQGYGPITLRHLLTHTSGLDEIPGRQFNGTDPVDLATFMKTRMVRYRAPGLQTAYGTYGIMLAGLLIEDVSGLPYEAYVRKHFFEPLRMRTARVVARRGDEQGVATPYTLEDGKAAPAPYEYYVSTPASSVVASASDMARLISAHLAAGSAEGRQLLPGVLMSAMHRQQATVHPALPGWSLGMQMDRVNGLRLAEHGGDIGGFAMLLVLIPAKDLGFYIVSHGEGSDLRFKVREALIESLFPRARESRLPVARAASPRALAAYEGRYLSSMACHSCAPRDGDVFEVKAQPDGTLSLWGQRWVPDGKDLFVRDDGKRLLGFRRDAKGRPVAVSGGSWRVADRLGSWRVVGNSPPGRANR